MTIAGVILAGGKSSRMGQPKEGVVLPNGVTMMEQVARVMNPLVNFLLVSGRSKGFDPMRLGAKHVLDEVPDEGPMAGIAAALACGAADHYLIVPCDMLLLDDSFLRKLLPATELGAAFRTCNGNQSHPFPCLLPATFCASARAAIDAGQSSPRRWLESLAVDWRMVPPDEEEKLISFNAPDVLTRYARVLDPRGVS